MHYGPRHQKVHAEAFFLSASSHFTHWHTHNSIYVDLLVNAINSLLIYNHLACVIFVICLRMSHSLSAECGRRVCPLSRRTQRQNGVLAYIIIIFPTSTSIREILTRPAPAQHRRRTTPLPQSAMVSPNLCMLLDGHFCTICGV